MAQIAAANVTYSLVEGSRVANACDPRLSAIFNVSFGNGTLTYTNGGIPLSKAKLGCPANLQELYLINDANGSGLVYKYNHTAETIQIYETGSHLHDFVMAGGVTTTADFLYHSAGAIGKAASTNVTIAGNASAAVLGGVVGKGVAALTEVLTSAAVSATTLRMRVVGW